MQTVSRHTKKSPGSREVDEEGGSESGVGEKEAKKSLHHLEGRRGSAGTTIIFKRDVDDEEEEK